MVTAPQRHSWPIPSIIPYWACSILSSTETYTNGLTCLRPYLRTFMISYPAFLSRSWPLDGDQNSCILKVVPAVIFVGPNNLQPKATNGYRCKLCVCVSLHIGDSHNAFELPISDYTVHCAGPFWSPKLSHSVSAFALWVGLWFQYVSIRITHSTRLSNLQILELTMTMPAFVPRDFWPPSAHDCWTSPPHPSVASGDGNLSTFP